MSAVAADPGASAAAAANGGDVLAPGPSNGTAKGYATDIDMDAPASPSSPPLPAAYQPSYKDKRFGRLLGSNGHSSSVDASAGDVVDLTELKRLAWNGVPSRWRPMVWQMLLGYLPCNRTRREQVTRRLYDAAVRFAVYRLSFIVYRLSFTRMTAVAPPPATAPS